MNFKSFRATILARVSLLALTIFLAVLTFSAPSRLAYALLLTGVCLAQVWELIRYISRLDLEIRQFTQAVHYRDFTQYYNLKNSPVLLKELRRAFNEVNTTFQQLNAEKEIQYQHLKTIIEMIDTGILSYDEEDQVKWMNESFRKMFALPELKHLSSLMARNPELKKLVENPDPGPGRLIQLQTGRSFTRVLTSVARFKVNGKINHLLAVKNINEAVEETETLAWQKLLRVLTHEIMNSVAPITSLAETLKYRINQLEQAPDPDFMEDINLSIEVIRSRSEGLMKFADTYRSLSKIIEPALSVVYVQELFQQIERLMKNELQKQEIEFTWKLRDPGLTLQIDVSLIEQVLLNLILNAIDALKYTSDKKISLFGYLNEQERVVIQLNDTGQGIPDELRESIFVPFFTTKKEGSGIGLSLSKQIMQIHKGTILVDSEPGKGSIFRLMF